MGTDTTTNASKTPLEIETAKFEDMFQEAEDIFHGKFNGYTTKLPPDGSPQTVIDRATQKREAEAKTAKENNLFWMSIKQENGEELSTIEAIYYQSQDANGNLDQEKFNALKQAKIAELAKAKVEGMGPTGPLERFVGAFQEKSGAAVEAGKKTYSEQFSLWSPSTWGNVFPAIWSGIENLLTGLRDAFIALAINYLPESVQGYLKSAKDFMGMGSTPMFQWNDPADSVKEIKANNKAEAVLKALGVQYPQYDDIKKATKSLEKDVVAAEGASAGKAAAAADSGEAQAAARAQAIATLKTNRVNAAGDGIINYSSDGGELLNMIPEGRQRAGLISYINGQGAPDNIVMLTPEVDKQTGDLGPLIYAKRDKKGKLSDIQVVTTDEQGNVQVKRPKSDYTIADEDIANPDTVKAVGYKILGEANGLEPVTDEKPVAHTIAKVMPLNMNKAAEELVVR